MTTIDLSKTIESKSDHLGADDLIGGAKTVEITNVSVVAGDRPVVIDYTGSTGKVFLPCKSMRRVMVAVWGSDGSKYIGQSMTLYRDESVIFGGKAVGGVRISHMTGLNTALKIPLSASRGKKSVFHVEPLVVQSFDSIEAIYVQISGTEDVEQLNAIYKRNINHPDIESIKAACGARKQSLTEQA